MRFIRQLQSLLLVTSKAIDPIIKPFSRTMVTTKLWKDGDDEQAKEAKAKLRVWPLDEYNVALLNEVHPLDYTNSDEPHEVYDLIAVGAGAGGLVSSKQVRVLLLLRCRHVFHQ